ncbi:MAG: hypothetical protein ACI4ML_03165 [Aristaeellaceae bacterium]
MKEAELRNRLQSLYPEEPEATHQAYLMALSSRKERHVMKRKLTLVPVLALLLVLALAATAVAVNYYSVTRYPRGEQQEFLNHLITLNEHYSNDLIDMSVNDFVFDGQTIDVAIDITRKTDTGFYMDMKLTAVDENGRTYMVDVEGMRGGDFLSGFYCPDLWGDGSGWTEADGYGFDGVIWDEEGNPPPDGSKLDWTMTFTVLRPLWPVEAMDEAAYNAGWDSVRQACMDAWRDHRILYTPGLTEYAFDALEAMGLSDEEACALRKVDALVRCGAFEKADTIVCTFATRVEDDVQREEVTGLRFPMEGFDLVIDRLDLSFQRLILEAHYDFGREMALEELEQADVPRVWLVGYNGGEAKSTLYAGPDFTMNGQGEIDAVRLQLVLSDYLEGEVTSITLTPVDDDEAESIVPNPEQAVTIDLSK